MNGRRAAGAVRDGGGTVVVVLVLVVVALAAAGVGYGETRAVRTPTVHHAGASATPSPVAAATRPASAPASAAATAAPLPDAVPAALGSALTTAALGSEVRAQVEDVATGRVLLARGASVPAAPASTAKLLTAAAVLATRGPTYRIVTKVVAGSAPGSVVLVGGGDPTLTAARGATRPAYPDAARITDLAAQLAARHVHATQVVVDDAAFAGPTVSPAWAAEDVPSSYGSAITAVMADGGRATPGAVIRSAQPDLDAGRALAADVGASASRVVRGPAPAGARVLATVRSAPVSELVEQMLLESDNVIAECLARQVAIATGGSPTFTGAAAAIRTTLTGLGVPIRPGMVDGSGLAAGDRLTAGELVGVLRLVAGGTRPRLATLLAGLPVAGWSGTLAARYDTSTSRPGAGVVRAKTGTLTGVSSLAGVVHDGSGRLLAFAFVADRAPSTPAADAALDVLAARLARCGCDTGG